MTGIIKATVGVGCMLVLPACSKSERLSVEPGAKPGERRFFEIQPEWPLAFRWIPKGSFERAGDLDPSYETPRKVNITHGFWMSETEVTRATWEAVMKKPRAGHAPALPVDCVSWHECMVFLSKLRTPAFGWQFALPNEDQWEHACRAGGSGPFHGRPEEIGWLEMNSDGHAHPVGMLKPNPWGLHDMHGNVAEWCRNTVEGSGGYRAIRGGSWDSDLSSEASSTNGDVPDLRINRVGFRIVLQNRTSGE